MSPEWLPRRPSSTPRMQAIRRGCRQCSGLPRSRVGCQAPGVRAWTANQPPAGSANGRPLTCRCDAYREPAQRASSTVSARRQAGFSTRVSSLPHRHSLQRLCLSFQFPAASVRRRPSQTRDMVSLSNMFARNDKCESYPIQDDPERGECFQHEMILKRQRSGRGTRRLNASHQAACSTCHAGADAGVCGLQRQSQFYRRRPGRDPWLRRGNLAGPAVRAAVEEGQRRRAALSGQDQRAPLGSDHAADPAPRRICQRATNWREADTCCAICLFCSPSAARSVTVQLPSLGFGQRHLWCCSHVFLLLEETLQRDYKLHYF